MNILIPHNWLLEHLDTKATPKQIQELVSLCGPTVEKIEEIDGEKVYDFEVTTNRVDSMSVRGIAREIATILPEMGIKAKLKPLKLIEKPTSKTDINLQIKNDPKLCKRIVTIKVSIDKVGESPQWLKDRLEQVGQRPLNNLIDITNYVMWEIGHPIHVFDYDRLTEKKIVVRQAKKGEKFTTLDNKRHSCQGGEVLFTDGTGNIVDLPGIMGTANSVVNDHTKTALFWIEAVPAHLIRAASMGLDIRTQAAVLNEKHVDPTLGMHAILRAVELAGEIAGGKVASQIIDIYPNPETPTTTFLSQNLLDTYLGTTIKPNKVTRILENLGCQVEAKKDGYQIAPPLYRTKDLQIPQDYIEEVARIHGYHNLEGQLMDTPIPVVDTNLDYKFEHYLKQLLVCWGATETYSYSFVSQNQAKDSGFPLSSHIKLSNPLTDDLVYMRRSLVPSHQAVFAANTGHHNQTLFELANTYQPRKADLPEERLELVISSSESFAKVKGLLDGLMKTLMVTDYQIQPNQKLDDYPVFDQTTSGVIVSVKTKLGAIGETKLGINSAVIDFETLRSVAKSNPTYTPIPTVSPVIEDLTFTLPPKTNIGPVTEAIKTTDKLINTVILKDQYQQNFTFTVQYLDPTNQLSDKAVAPIRKKIVKTLEKQFKVKLKGQLN